MRREECVDLFKRIPETVHAQINLVMHNCYVVSVDVVASFEPTYMVIRGREGGTSDEGRAFFVPYDEISYVRLEKPTRLSELKHWYGDTAYVDQADRLGREAEADEKQKAKPMDTATPPPAQAPSDPASIAKQNLLERIRAARANTGKLGGSEKK